MREMCIRDRPYSNGLARNIEQCLRDFEIPLLLSHTITAIHGKERITGVTIAKVDEAKRVIPGTQEDVKCDTLLLSVGLIPENELSRNAQIELDPKTNGPVVNAVSYKHLLRRRCTVSLRKRDSILERVRLR